MAKNLKRKRFRARDENGKQTGDITAASLVTEPAIEKDFQFFEKEKIHFQTSKERMEITGPAMLCDTDILRYDKVNKEYYYCYFTAEDVRDFMEIFMTNGSNVKANFEHGDYFSDDIKVIESWIVEDPECDKCKALGFTDIPKGTWMITYKTRNEKLWETIKNSDMSGFSVEIELDKFQMIELEEDIENDLTDILNELFFSKEEKQKAIKDIVNFYSFVKSGEISFSDYPEGAVLNAKRALEWMSNNPDKSCGNKLMWTRARQIANKQPLSYSNLKRIVMNSKFENKANQSTYEEGCFKISWDALGGSDLLYWSMAKLNQIDELISAENEKQKALNKGPFGL